MQFTTKTGEKKDGEIVYSYTAFENGQMRYIFSTADGEYRCINVNGEYTEYVS